LALLVHKRREECGNLLAALACCSRLLDLFISADVGIIGSFVTAFIGACILLFLVRLFTGNRGASTV
jgi:uncharacterized membrane protein YeaQ/YmgE (transglycosylase-associated protein family)